MKNPRTTASWSAGTEALLDQILTDAYGEDEQLWAFRQAFEDNVPLTVDAFVIGEPVEVLEVDYDGNTRRGLTARCRRQDGGEHEVAASEVVFPEGSEGARHVAAYRMWLGLEPAVVTARSAAHWPKRHKAGEQDLDLGSPIELVVLAPKERAARCRILGTERGRVGHGARRDRHRAPPQAVDVRPPPLPLRRRGEPPPRHRRARPDPLCLQDEWLWDPGEEYWGEEAESIEEWAKPIIGEVPVRRSRWSRSFPARIPTTGPVTRSSRRAT